MLNFFKLNSKRERKRNRNTLQVNPPKPHVEAKVSPSLCSATETNEEYSLRRKARA